MPQHKKLSLLPLRINPAMPKNDQEWQAFLAQLQNHFNAIAGIDLCSGLTKFSDSVNKGYYLGFTRNDDGYADGTPVFVVGDRDAEKYFEFDGDDLNIGTNTQFVGVDSFNNNDSLYHTWFESLDNFTVSNSGSGTVTQSGGVTSLAVTGASGDLAEIKFKPTYIAREAKFLTSWPNCRFKTRIRSSGAATSNILTRIYVGDASAGDGFGFRMSNSATIQGFVLSGGVETTVSLDVSYAASDVRLLEARFGDGVAAFYVDGDLKGSIVQGIVGTTSNRVIMHISTQNTGAGSANDVRVSEWIYMTE